MTQPLQRYHNCEVTIIKKFGNETKSRERPFKSELSLHHDILGSDVQPCHLSLPNLFQAHDMNESAPYVYDPILL